MLGEQGDQRGLAQRLDDVLFRLESWRPVDRAAAIRVLCGLVVIALGAGWWYGRSAGAAPVEDLIPVATADVMDGDEDDSASETPGEDPPASGPVPAPPAPTQSSASASNQLADGDEAASSVAVEVSLVVHVIGAVARPGLVSVPAGSRVADVVTAAGGSTAEAAVDRLNLAAPVSDGMQVRVPTIDDDSEVPLMTAAPPPATSGSDPGAPGAGVESGPVNLNTASTEQLDTLPGIGPATAAAIIRWREDNGGFHLLEDLLAVPGIGPAKMAAIRDLVTV